MFFPIHLIKGLNIVKWLVKNGAKFFDIVAVLIYKWKYPKESWLERKQRRLQYLEQRRLKHLSDFEQDKKKIEETTAHITQHLQRVDPNIK